VCGKKRDVGGEHSGGFRGTGEKNNVVCADHKTKEPRSGSRCRRLSYVGVICRLLAFGKESN